MNYAVNYSKMINGKYSSCFTICARNADTSAISGAMYAELQRWCGLINSIENAGHTFTDAKYSGMIAVPSPKSDNDMSKADVNVVVYSDNASEPKTCIIRVKDCTFSTLVQNVKNAYQNAVGHSLENNENDYITNCVVILHN